MSNEVNKSAQEVIDRLWAINYDEPYWNEAEVVKALKRQYELLKVPMPNIVVAKNAAHGAELARGAARDAAWDAARGAAWDAARGAARGAAWDAAWDAARGAAARNLGLKDKQVDHYIEVKAEMLKALENGLGFYFPMQDNLILVPMPRMIMNGDRLHYDHGKAVEWKDGTGFYFLHGVQFDEKLYNDVISHRLTAEQTLNIRDSDQRMAAIAMLRPDRLLKQMKAKLIHTGLKGTKLYEVKNFMQTNRTEYCMWMVDSSTPREFIEWVEPDIGKQSDADLCQAHAFGITLEDYLNITQEA